MYNTLTALKLGFSYNKRFKIAAEYIESRDSVIDVCSGTGVLSGFLPDGCVYECIDASVSFSAHLAKKGIKHHCYDIRSGMSGGKFRADVVIMIISLAHFRKTVIHELLEDFKNIAERVVIIEDVLIKKRKDSSILQKVMNFLCGIEYELFTAAEFEKLMKEHGYSCKKNDKRYYTGYFARKE
ncbi:MAG: methyltransferase domain-containing protein [Elusimicrobiota bacterium]